jgi:hypothetical protein
LLFLLLPWNVPHSQLNHNLAVNFCRPWLQIWINGWDPSG